MEKISANTHLTFQFLIKFNRFQSLCYFFLLLFSIKRTLIVKKIEGQTLFHGEELMILLLNINKFSKLSCYVINCWSDKFKLCNIYIYAATCMYVGVTYIYTQVPSSFYLIILSYKIDMLQKVHKSKALSGC